MATNEQLPHQAEFQFRRPRVVRAMWRLFGGLSVMSHERERRAPGGRVPIWRITRPLAATFRTGDLRVPGRVVNLSGVGLFIATSRPPEPGARIRVVIQQASGEEIEVIGTVRWSTVGRGFGMEIDDPSEDYVQLYHELLRALFQRQRSAPTGA